MTISNGGVFKEKDPEEIITVTCEFSDLTVPISVDPIVATNVGGARDDTPEAILSGPTSIIDNLAMQRIHGGVDGARYGLRCVGHGADGSVTVIVASLPVATRIPA